LSTSIQVSASMNAISVSKVIRKSTYWLSSTGILLDGVDFTPLLNVITRGESKIDGRGLIPRTLVESLTHREGCLSP